MMPPHLLRPHLLLLSYCIGPNVSSVLSFGPKPPISREAPAVPLPQRKPAGAEEADAQRQQQDHDGEGHFLASYRLNSRFASLNNAVSDLRRPAISRRICSSQ